MQVAIVNGKLCRFLRLFVVNVLKNLQLFYVWELINVCWFALQKNWLLWHMSALVSYCRQLKATVDWLVSEQMLIYYTQTFKDSFWPDGECAKPSPPRTDQQKQEDRIQAKTKLLENMPGRQFFFFFCFLHSLSSSCTVWKWFFIGY